MLPVRKYTPLLHYLAALPPAQQTVTLTMAELEQLLGCSLPASAWSRTYWRSSHVARSTWQARGFSARLDYRPWQVTFTRQLQPLGERARREVPADRAAGPHPGQRRRVKPRAYCPEPQEGSQPMRCPKCQGRLYREQADRFALPPEWACWQCGWRRTYSVAGLARRFTIIDPPDDSLPDAAGDLPLTAG
jgi:hypothetical protein